METVESRMERFADRVSQQKLREFTRLLRKNLKEVGVDGDIFDNAAQATSLELQIEEAQQSITQSALQSYENRGMDTVGRIVVEFCFVRSAQGKMIWPEYSDEDTMARWQFSDAVVPRPLMRYFLVSVRGSIDEIDGFTSDSFLFEDNPDKIASIRQQIGDLIEDFKGPFGSGESSVDWQAVYEDQRFQELALSLVTQMRERVNEQGLETYLNRLEEYRQIDPQNEETNLMQRPLTIEDASQIDRALEAAQIFLSDTN